MELILFLICLVISLFIGLLLRRKKPPVITPEPEKPPPELEKSGYYIFERSLKIYQKQLKSIKQYKTQLDSRLESIKQQNRELADAQFAIIKAKQMQEYSGRIGIAKQNLSRLEKCIHTISITNDVNVLSEQYQSALEHIRWFREEEMHYPDAPYLLVNGYDNFMNAFNMRFNDMICRVATYHLVKYKYKFHELYTIDARNRHTQKIFVTLDTLMGMIAIADNGEMAFDKLKEYYGQVKDNADINYDTSPYTIKRAAELYSEEETMVKYRLDELKKLNKTFKTAKEPAILESCKSNMIEHVEWFMEEENREHALFALAGGASNILEKIKNRYNERLYSIVKESFDIYKAIMSAPAFIYNIDLETEKIITQIQTFKGFMEKTAENYQEYADAFKKFSDDIELVS
jgi:hypothetical protein